MARLGSAVLAWLDSETLSTHLVKNLPTETISPGISDGKFVYLPPVGSGPDMRHPIAETEKSHETLPVPTEVLIAVGGNCYLGLADSKRFISSLDGKVCWSGPQPKNGSLGGWGANAACRFVTPETDGIPPNGKGEFHTALRVRDCSHQFDLIVAGNVRHEGKGVTAFGGPMAGLSSDGKTLVAITGHGVELYNLGD